MRLHKPANLVRRFITSVILFSVPFLAAQTVQGQVPSLLSTRKAISEDTNAIAIFDYSALQRSSFAAKNGIEVGDFIGMPENSRFAAIVADVDFEYWSSESHLGLFALETQKSLSDLKTNKRLIVDDLGDGSLVWTAERVSVSDLADGTMVVLPGRNRQKAVRTLRNLHDTNAADHGSKFLNKALQRVRSPQTFFVLAMDVEGAISPAAAERTILSNGDVFPEAIQDKARQLLSGIEGFVVTVNVGDSIVAMVELEFASDARLLNGRGAGLVNSWLENFGARIDAVERWNTTVKGNRVAISGPISLDTMQDIASLAIQDATFPQTARKIKRELENANPDSGIGSKVATVQFMGKMKKLLATLQAKAANQPNRSRFWLDRYAMRVQYLDRDFVDDNALRFADRTTAQLRLMSEVLENAAIAAEQLDNTLPFGVRVNTAGRTVLYGSIPIQRQAFFFTGGNFAAGLAVANRAADQRANDAVLKVNNIAAEVIADFNSTGQAVAKKYDVPFNTWVP